MAVSVIKNVREVSTRLNYYNLCSNIVQFDGAVRFVGVANLDGKIFAAIYREGVKSLLTEELELSIMQSLVRMNMRKTLKAKLGRTLYSTTVYENERRATMSLLANERTDDVTTYLMVSFEKDTDHEEIITIKILPFLESVGGWS